MYIWIKMIRKKAHDIQQRAPAFIYLFFISASFGHIIWEFLAP